MDNDGLESDPFVFFLLVKTWVQGHDSSETEVVWPSGLRRWTKAPVSMEAWVQIPPLPSLSPGTWSTHLQHTDYGRRLGKLI